MNREDPLARDGAEGGQVALETAVKLTAELVRENDKKELKVRLATRLRMRY